MIEVLYANSFLRQFKKLPAQLQDEAREKIQLFKDTSTHKSLKVHKLHGDFAGRFSFSVNYSYRIVFEWTNKKEALFMLIGDHKLYDK